MNEFSVNQNLKEIFFNQNILKERFSYITLPGSIYSECIHLESIRLLKTTGLWARIRINSAQIRVNSARIRVNSAQIRVNSAGSG